MKAMKKYACGFVRWMSLLILVSAFWLALPAGLRHRLEPRVLAAPMTFTVNSNNDADDGACNAAHCSLREAIKAANANSGADTINFNIPGAGAQRISPSTQLPDITDVVTINGYSQPGASANTLPSSDNAVLLIELNGSAIPCPSSIANASVSRDEKGMRDSKQQGSPLSVGNKIRPFY